MSARKCLGDRLSVGGLKAYNPAFCQKVVRVLATNVELEEFQSTVPSFLSPLPHPSSSSLQLQDSGPHCFLRCFPHATLSVGTPQDPLSGDTCSPASGALVLEDYASTRIPCQNCLHQWEISQNYSPPLGSGHIQGLFDVEIPIPAPTSGQL